MKFWQVDSFTNQVFKGNPAAVFVLKEDIPDSLKQDIAMEMAVSETAFVLINDSASQIRWFTPNSEVNLCGHATLAAGHVLWQEGFISDESITLESKSGQLSISKDSKAYTLNFPAQPPNPKESLSDLARQIIGVEPKYIGSNSEDLVVVIDDVNYLKTVSPDLDLICKLPERGLLLTAQDSSGEYDFIYRAFFPKLAVPEDPVTGSATTLLAPYWSKVLGKSCLKAYQASKRGGELLLELSGDRVHISGQAVTVVSGELHINK